MVLGAVLLLGAGSVRAAAPCSGDGVTVVYVNGILTTEDEALSDKTLLEQTFREKTGLTGVQFVAGYNPSHIAGMGDFIKVLEQTYEDKNASPIDDFDLEHMLQQIHGEVTTQKIALVGYSQGTFYTNALYEYLTTHGVPPQSLVVYNIATPASFVAGRTDYTGTYMTSSNDSVVNEVRRWAALSGAYAPLPANITLPLFPGESTQITAGHSISADYLAHAPVQISTGMRASLGLLSASNRQVSRAPADGCFTPPPLGLVYRAEQFAFALADPVAGAIITSAQMAYGTVVSFTSAAERAAAAILGVETGAVRAIGTLAVFVTGAVGNALTSVPAETQIAGVSAQTLAAMTANASASTIYVERKATTTRSSADLITYRGQGAGATAASSTTAATTPAATSTATVFATTTVASTTQHTVSHQAATSTNGIGRNWIAIAPGFGGGGSSRHAGDTIAASSSPQNQDATSTPDQQATSTPDVATSTPPDTTPPGAPVISIADCNYSLSATSTGCLLSAGVATVQWADVPHATHYLVWVNGVLVASTTATSTGVLLSDGQTATVLAVAVGAFGDAATSTSLSASAYAQPVIINEVSWAGNDASAGDEWVELKNRTPYPIDLSRLALVSADGSVFAPMSGTLAPHDGSNGEYFIVYRASNPIHADAYPGQSLQVSFPALAGGVQQLKLVQGLGGLGTTTLDATPAAGACGGNWCAGVLAVTPGSDIGGGAVAHSASMERVDASVVGTVPSNWATNDRYSPADIRDTNGNKVFASPLNANSEHWPDAGWLCSPSMEPPPAGSAYHPGSASCTYLSAFLDDGISRMGMLYRGTVGSSTMINGHSMMHALDWQSDALPNDMVVGEPYFIVIQQYSYDSQVDTDFNTFFTAGGIPAPNDHYRVISFTYAP